MYWSLWIRQASVVQTPPGTAQASVVQTRPDAAQASVVQTPPGTAQASVVQTRSEKTNTEMWDSNGNGIEAKRSEAKRKLR